MRLKSVLYPREVIVDELNTRRRRLHRVTLMLLLSYWILISECRSSDLVIATSEAKNGI